MVPLTAARIRRFRQALLAWYDQCHRELPWRCDPDAYRVWISEIMLQQTRVAAVVDHYVRFLRRFPTVQALAAAREASVLAAWSGLGYYHRARRLHQAARVIIRERHGKFPRTAGEWLQLPGIGRYTAAAIASIAFGEPVAVVDGNVQRVLQRLFATTDDGESSWSQASALLDHTRPGDFNQAMMELGATICTPRVPQCLLCPLNRFCQSRGAGEKRLRAPRKREELRYILARRHAAVLLVQRPAEASLMAGMWELPPLSQTNGSVPLLRLRHSITSTDYQVSVFNGESEQSEPCAPDGRWFTRSQYERLPLTGLTRKILRRLSVASSPAAEQSKVR